MNVEMKHIPHNNAYHIHFNYIDPPTQLKVIAFSEVFTNKQDAENAVKLVKLVKQFDDIIANPDARLSLTLEVKCVYHNWYILCTCWHTHRKRSIAKDTILFTTETAAWIAIDVIKTMRSLKSS